MKKISKGFVILLLLAIVLNAEGCSTGRQAQGAGLERGTVGLEHPGTKKKFHLIPSFSKLGIPFFRKKKEAKGKMIGVDYNVTQ